MLRVLHLRAEPSDEQARRLSNLLASRTAAAAVVECRTIGRAGTYRSVLDAVVRLRRDVRGFDVVHAWDVPGLTAASWAGAPNIVASLSDKLPRLRTWETPGRVHWACSTPYQLALARDRFGDQGRYSLIEPGLTAPQPNPMGRQTPRMPLGLAEDDRVLLAPGESTRNAGHEAAVWVVSMLHIIDPRYKLLIAGTGRYAAAATRLARALNRPDLLRVAADAAPLTPVADAVLFTPTGETPVLPVVECMTAGLPVVTTNHPAFRGYFMNRRAALVAEWDKPPSIARRVLELFEQPGLLQSMGEQARGEAAERFAAGAFVERYLEIYRAASQRRTGAPNAA
jgi:glycosyltransferase involved in cell wall biosynthesis